MMKDVIQTLPSTRFVCARTSWIHGILVYRFNKQASHVLLSIQFDTNVSQLLRRVMPWCCDPLPYLGELSWSRLNGLSVCLSCLFWLCIPPAVYGRHILSLRCLRVALFSEKKRGFFIFFPIFFPKKMDSHHKKIKKIVLVSPDVSPAPPHLTTDVSPWQLSQKPGDKLFFLLFYCLKKKEKI